MILVDHGSRRDESNAMLLDVVRDFVRATGMPIVEPAHMELAEPSIATAFARCVAPRGDDRRCVSVFLVAGPALARRHSAVGRRGGQNHPGVRYLVTAPFGLHPLMAEVMQQRIAHCLAHTRGEADACELCAGTDRCQLREASD